MIELKHIHAARSGIKLFTDFSWKIDDGENWLITGPNGSGKTVLLELLAGHLHVTQGSIDIDFIHGVDWDERYLEKKRKIHLIPAHAVQSLLRQHQDQYYQQRYFGIGDERTPLVRDILGGGNLRLESLELPESFSIQALLDLELTRLSNGQLKKVLLIRVLLAGIPRVLLFDFPFEGLDVTSRAELSLFIDFIADKYGTQIILVDHHHQLPTCLNHKLLLEKGRVASQSKLKVFAENRRAIVRKDSVATNGDPVVEINNLKIQYSESVILDNFNWTVRKGERWALTGRNGAGKTTLFSMIFADHPMAYSQDISLFGRRRGTGESIWDIKKRIGYLGPELMSYLSPGQTVLKAGDYLRAVVRPWNDTKFDKLVESLEVSAFIDRPIRMLSSGEQQIILIISCLMKEAEMLLLDEPFQFLDDRQKKNFRDYLSLYLSPDQTLILITHYEEDLREWTDHTKQL
ncbi:MAG: ATP-binding cassette domain-containing protein [Chryseolinea sp.]